MYFDNRPPYRARAIDTDEIGWPRSRSRDGFFGGVLRGVSRRREIPASAFPFLAAMVELAALWVIIFEAGAFYHWFALGYLPSPLFYGMAAAALAALYVGQCAFARDQSIKRLLDSRGQYRAVFIRWNSAYALWVFALFMLQATEFYSRGSVVVQYAAGLLAAFVFRHALARFAQYGLRIGLIGGRRTVVIGERTQLRPLLHHLRRDGRGASMVDVVTLDAGGGGPQTQEVLQHVERLARRTGIDDIVLALPWSANEQIHNYLEGLSAVPATIHLAPDRTMAWIRNPVLARVGGHYTLRLSRAPLTLKDHMIKRMFDVAVASGLLLAASPLLFAIAIAIKLDTPGPVLFRQRRNGFNQHEFRVFKFRTMRTLDDGPVIRQATKDDRRITRVGRLLRRTNLDEVPQLLNVLLGHMSLVGPRPHAVAHNDEYEQRIQLYARRHNVKPGITGWAQVNGYRGETDRIEKMQRRVEHDLFYIDHWSVPFDVKILLMTLLSPKSYRNAY